MSDIYEDGAVVVSFADIIKCFSGTHNFPPNKFPSRCIILGVFSFSDVIAGSSDRRHFRDIALVLNLDPFDLLLVVRGPAIDGWTKSFWEHWGDLACGSTDYVLLAVCDGSQPRFDYPRVTPDAMTGFFIHGALLSSF